MLHRTGVVWFCLALGLLAPARAPALQALFDFQDFPGVDWHPGGPSTDPYTYLYGCNGKNYCSEADLWEAYQIESHNTPFLDSLTKQTGGITLTVQRPGDGWQLYRSGNPQTLGQINVTTYNGDASYDLFLADFDVDLAFVSMTVAHPEHDDVDEETGEHDDANVRLYLWEGAGATGGLVASLLISPHDDLLGIPLQIELAAPAGQTFRSMSVGHALSADPDCIQNCPETTRDNGFFFDDVFVSTIPEPGTASLLALGLVALSSRRPRASARSDGGASRSPRS